MFAVRRSSAWFTTIALAVTGTGVQAQIIRAGANAIPYDTAVVTVIGTAHEYVSPTRAVVFLQIVSTGNSPESAAMENGSARASVLTQLEDLGLGGESVGLWGLGSGSAAPAYGPPRGDPSASYETRSGLRVEVSDLGRLDPVVSSSLLAGATISRIELHSAAWEEAQQRTVARAVRQARAAAEAMAEAAGGRLGDLLSLSSADLGGTSYWMVPYNRGPGEDGVSLSETDTSVRATVQATWVFVPARS